MLYNQCETEAQQKQCKFNHLNVLKKQSHQKEIISHVTLKAAKIMLKTQTLAQYTQEQQEPEENA